MNYIFFPYGLSYKPLFHFWNNKTTNPHANIFRIFPAPQAQTKQSRTGMDRWH